MSLNVSLTPELEQLIAEKVESGMYTTASEVVREGLRLLREADLDREAWRAEAGEKLERSFKQASRDELSDGREAMPRENDRMERTVRERRKKRA
jgi:antitoxin ParD1/3/4